jgi:hypothetical protein
MKIAHVELKVSTDTTTTVINGQTFTTTIVKTTFEEIRNYSTFDAVGNMLIFNIVGDGDEQIVYNQDNVVGFYTTTE